MARKLDDSVFNQASERAMQEALLKTAEQRLRALGPTGYQRVLEQLRAGAGAVDPALIAELESAIDAATDKNKVITDVIKKGISIAQAIAAILR
jgi:hypothetical protein